MTPFKAKGNLYLPKPEGQTAVAYQAYLSRARWYDVPERTRRGLLGTIFRKAPR